MAQTLPHEINVAGAPIRWGIRGSGPRDLVLVHGNGANHAWWNAIAPDLESSWRLILLDMSGHGDSGHRPQYHPDFWVEEISSVIDAAQSQRPVLVGHSMGGRASLATAAAHPDKVSGLVVLDASVRPAHMHRVPTIKRRTSKVYRTREEIVKRFRLMPVQPPAAPDVMSDLADHSITQIDGGWTWKYDPQSLMRFNDSDVDASAHNLRCPLGYIYGSESVVVNDELAQYVADVVPSAQVFKIEGAHHHVILDRPRECSALIDRLAREFTRVPNLA